MSLPVTRGTPEGDKDEETFNTKKRPAQEKENSPKKNRNQLKRDESKQGQPRPALYDLSDDLCGNILSYAADGIIVSRLCELQLISHKWYNIVMSETCSSESWDMAFKLEGSSQIFFVVAILVQNLHTAVETIPT